MIRGAVLTNDGGELFVELIDLANPAAAGFAGEFDQRDRHEVVGFGLDGSARSELGADASPPVRPYHYQRREYDEALVSAKRVNMSLFANSHIMAAAAAGRLGRRDEARAALEALARIDVSLVEPERIRAHSGYWLWDVEQLDHIMAGIEIGRWEGDTPRRVRASWPPA